MVWARHPGAARRYRVCKYVTQSAARRARVCKYVTQQRPVEQHVCKYVTQQRPVEYQVCKHVSKTEEVNVSYVHTDWQKQTVMRTEQYCQRVPYQTTVRVPVCVPTPPCGPYLKGLVESERPG